MEQETARYRIVGDNSGHKYVIPVAKSEDWSRWMEIPDDDERAWVEPEYAVRIDGNFTFTDPRCE